MYLPIKNIAGVLSEVLILGVVEEKGKAVLLTLPLHNGYDPLLDGNNNFQDFLEYLLTVEFTE